MTAKGFGLNDFCRALEDAHGEVLATSDRECLLNLHRALAGLKEAVEMALVQIHSDEYLPN
jgi:hypothetical protein